MVSKSLFTKIAAAAVLVGATLSAPAMANGNGGFTALQGVEVRALSTQEMAAITGELNAYDIAFELTALANTTTNTTLKNYLVRLANYYTTNAKPINALFDKYNILTPCYSCTK
jgi:hypothetical protein